MSDHPADPENLEVRRCPTCGTRNRVDRLRLDSAVCSRCRAPLAAAPVDTEVTELPAVGQAPLPAVGHAPVRGRGRTRNHWLGAGGIAAAVVLAVSVAHSCGGGSRSSVDAGDTLVAVTDSLPVPAPPSTDTTFGTTDTTTAADFPDDSAPPAVPPELLPYADTLRAIAALQDSLRLLMDPDSESVMKQALEAKHRADLVREMLERLTHLMEGVEKHEPQRGGAGPREAGLPPLIRSGPAGTSRRTATITVRNDTQYALTVIVRSVPPSGITIPPRGTRSFESPSGQFSVYASVDAGDVQPFFGSWTLTPGGYRTSFYISEERR